VEELMKKLMILFFLFFLLCLGTSPARADVVVLQDWTFNVNGNTNFNCLPVACTPNVPPFLSFAGFDFNTGLGTVSGTYNPGAGTYFLIFYVDHDIVGPNNLVQDETGTAVGTASTLQMWEIDEPGFTTGQLVFDVLNGVLTNSAWPSGTVPPNDVAMALGWSFTLGPGESLFVTWTVSPNAPSSGFYLEQHDPQSGQTLYFSSNSTVRAVIPEPATGLLVLTGLGLAALRRKS
jgi:hypothetical protein